jgi:hypothetical protein
MESYDQEDEAEREEDEEDDNDDKEEENKIDEDVVRQPARTKAPRGRGKGRGKMQEVEPENIVRQTTQSTKAAQFAERGRNIRAILGPLGKLHNLVVHIRSSANRTTWFVSNAGRMIPLDNRTRWNSWWKMISVALDPKIRTGLSLYFEKYQNKIPKEDLLSTEDWMQLRTIHNFLKAFHDATLFIQGSRPTLERVLESIAILERTIQRLQVYRTILYSFLLLIIILE